MRWAPAVTVSLVMSFSIALLRASLPRRGPLRIGLFPDQPNSVGYPQLTPPLSLSPPSSECRTEAIQRRVPLARLGYHLDEAPFDGCAPGGLKLSTGPAQALGKTVSDPECPARPVLSLKKANQRTQVWIGHQLADGFRRQPRPGQAEAVLAARGVAPR